MKSNWICHHAKGVDRDLGEGVDRDLGERWATNLTERMKEFVETAGQLFADMDRDGVHAASPINLSLPSIMKLCAGWATYGSALACEHCREQLGLRQGGAKVPLEALLQASHKVAWFVARLLVKLSETSDADGQAVPWLPDWAKPAYEAYVKKRAGESLRMLPIYYACTEDWGLAMADNYLSMLMMELGKRLVGRSAQCPALERILCSLPTVSVYTAFEANAWQLLEQIDEKEQFEAWRELLVLFEAYLCDYADSKKLVLPPPGVLMH